MSSREVVVIAETGERFADFAPYVASINDAGAVAFQAALVEGGSGVFVGSGGAVGEVDCGGCSEIISHPDIDARGAVCFYAQQSAGNQAVMWSDGGGARTLADTPSGVLGEVGPLGPTMNDHQVVAFRGTSRDGAAGVFTAGPQGLVTVATIGDQFRAFDGLPVVVASGAVVFRAETNAGVTGIYRHDERGVTTIVETGEQLAHLGRFPIVDDSGAVAFCATLAQGGDAIFIARGEQLCRVVDAGGPFESIRGVLIDDGALVAYYATPHGGQLAIYTGLDHRADRLVGIGDPMFGSTVTAFVLNPVSVSRARQLALRVELDDGRQFIVRADIS